MNFLLIGISIFSLGLSISSEALADTKPGSEPLQKAVSDVDHAVLSYHSGKMTRRIRSNLNPALCPQPNQELLLEVRLTEKGDLADVPKFITRSNNSDCDDAVMRAIYAAKPFDMPSDHPKELKLMTEPMLLKFKPRG
jgi:colicin import membrane protein